MNILYCNSTSVHGGAEEMLVRYMQAARETGHVPFLLVPDTGWLTQKCAQESIQYYLMSSLPDAFTTEAWTQFKPLLKNAFLIRQLVKSLRIGLIHSNSPRVSYHAGLAARLAGIPSVVHVHDIVDLPYASHAKATLLSFVADMTLAVSCSVEREIVNLAGVLKGRTRTVYNGWDPAVYRGVKRIDLSVALGIQPGRRVVGQVAAMTPWKGQEVIISAMPAILRVHPSAHLVMVGAARAIHVQQAHEAMLRSMVKRLGLCEYVTFTGWRDDVWDVINSFEVMVHTPIRPDPLPTVLLHASALGKPIVASQIGGIPEIVAENDTGLIVPACDSPATADAVIRLLSDQGLGAELGRNARERFASVFSWTKMKGSLGEVYAKY